MIDIADLSQLDALISATRARLAPAEWILPPLSVATERPHHSRLSKFQQVELDGVTMTVAQVAEQYKIPVRTVLHRLDRGWTIEETVCGYRGDLKQIKAARAGFNPRFSHKPKVGI